MLTVPPSPAVTDKVYEGVIDSEDVFSIVDSGSSTKFAVIAVLSDIVIVMFVSVNPFDQLENTYPSSGIAERAT